jgi:hypothetical protein
MIAGVSAEQVTAAASLVTSLSALLVAGIGGYWTLFRYRREDPHLPRVNASVDATLFSEDGLDYISFDATVTHVAGSALTIIQDAGRAPRVEVRRLTATSTVGELPPTTVATCPALTAEELAAGESTRLEGIVAAGARPAGAMAYEVRLSFDGEWKRRSWTWSRNKILVATTD